MCKQFKVLASEAIPSVKPFLSPKQLSGLIVKCAGKEGEFYMRSLVGLAGYVAALPNVEDLPVVVNRMAYLHYCCGDADWYIVGLSAHLLPGGRMVRAFVDSPTTPFQDCGLVLLPGLFRFGVDTTLDIVFEPCPLASLEAKAAALMEVFMISFMLGVAPLLGEARRGIFRTNSGLPLRRNMTYRVYARWPGQRTTHKTTTPYKSVAEAAWDELTSVSWPKDNKPIGLSYTHDGKQLDYVDLEKLDDGQ